MKIGVFGHLSHEALQSFYIDKHRMIEAKLKNPQKLGWMWLRGVESPSPWSIGQRVLRQDSETQAALGSQANT